MKSSFILVESKREKKRNHTDFLCVLENIRLLKLFDFVSLLNSIMKWAVLYEILWN